MNKNDTFTIMYRILLILTFFQLGISISYGQKVESWSVKDLEVAIANTKQNIVVVNFWATYCKPCVEEIPAIVKVVSQNKDSVVLILVNLDARSIFPNRLARFIKKHHFQGVFSWLNETNPNYFCPRMDSSWDGSIPATIMINKRKNIRRFIGSSISSTQFQELLKALIMG